MNILLDDTNLHRKICSLAIISKVHEDAHAVLLVIVNTENKLKWPSMGECQCGIFISRLLL